MTIFYAIKRLIKKIVPSSLIDRYHFFWALFGALLYRFPSRKIKVIGVTGTNGKTTTTEMIAKIFEEAGYKTALLNSIRFKIGKKEKLNKMRMTMPGRFFIQRFLKKAVNAGCKFAILEVTSEGIKQYRHQFINFDTAVITNLAPEHIEAHGGFENYKRTKGKLFQATKKVHVINLDDKNADYFLQFQAERKYLYKIKNQKSKIKNKERIKILEAKNYQSLPQGVRFFVNNEEFNLKLLGEFNVYNALAAICVGLSQGIDLKTCKRALEKMKGIPGRMETVIKRPFEVIVDYAFTPNALRKVYETLIDSKLKSQNSKLICVLGACGGGRDKWKRPVLGELAAKYCNKIILTNEDPYDEDPNQILLEIKSGIPKEQIPMTNLVLDRRKAIRQALKMAKAGDVVVITGKGCESSICLAGGKQIPWDDRKVVREEFEKLMFLAGQTSFYK